MASEKATPAKGTLGEMEYKKRFLFAEDFGSGYFKYGPITKINEGPDIIRSRGLVVKESIALKKIYRIEEDIVVGEKVSRLLTTVEDALKNIVYPLRSGIIDLHDELKWRVIKELARHAFNAYYGQFYSEKGFEGFLVVVALSALAPTYMYTKMFDIHRELDEEFDGTLIKAMTIIPQPLAVAISEQEVTTLVVECGHGNIQITPISSYPIKKAIIALNRGGDTANAITREILKDAGYSDIAKDEYAVEKVKIEAGLVPRDLKEAIRRAKEDPERFRVKVKIDPLTEVDLGDYSWARFLIGEIIFDPTHDEFTPYIETNRIMIEDVVVGNVRLYGTMSLADAIIESLRRTPAEVREVWLTSTSSHIILSGGALMWKAPERVRDVAVTAPEKVKIMLGKKVPDIVDMLNIRMVKDPQYSVWRGSLMYGTYLPLSLKWDNARLEGWYSWK